MRNSLSGRLMYVYLMMKMGSTRNYYTETDNGKA